MQGHIEASINLDRIDVRPYDFVSFLPNSILQIHKVEGDLRIYFMGFSSTFVQQIEVFKSSLNVLCAIHENPIISLQEKPASLLENYFKLLIDSYALYHEKLTKEVVSHVLSGVLLWLDASYQDKTSVKNSFSKSEKISKEFSQLVIRNYMKNRNVSFYAKSMSITPAHLCTTIKQVTGKTCTDIISALVIMDAKAQLKSTNSSIQEIAYSLSFTNMSFFGKYFKRNVGMSPLEYRLS